MVSEECVKTTCVKVAVSCALEDAAESEAQLYLVPTT